MVDRVRNSIKPTHSSKSRIEQAQRKLQLQVARLDQFSAKLRERDQALFGKVVSAVQQHDIQYSSMLSNELAQIRKISTMVGHAKLALEQIHIRLGTITELGDVVVVINPAMAEVNNLRANLAGMMPEVDNEMEEMSQLLSGVLIESGQVPNSTITYDTTSSDTQSILDEATSIAENSVKDRLPDLPTTVEQEKAPKKSNEEMLT
ncbi:MAG: Snf7 family protein [Nitrososphaerales archaeon]